ncbi:hypothetical protein [Ferruginibacter sp. SUN106]|uniref:hypothetical protein n=1 Tax=Ferruginibacter sp. SUN106 TaxID=2978348 RepID=UPI003D35C74A
MKAICIAVVVVLIVQSATAQVQPSNPESLLQPNKVSELLTTSNAPKAMLIGETTSGKIYAMPQDHMPCLVPNMSLQNSMPVYATPFVDTAMPNPIPKQDYFTAPSNKNLFFKPVKITPEPSKNLMLDLIRKK